MSASSIPSPRSFIIHVEIDADEIGRIVVDSAFQLHRKLGPGLLERVYHVVLARAWRGAGCSWSPGRGFRSKTPGHKGTKSDVPRSNPANRN
jgi:hypothetical protein